MGTLLAARLERLHPAYFAMVMATGVLSIAARLQDLPYLPRLLLWLNLGLYAGLWLLTLARVVRFPRSFLADWSDHQRGVGFFTTVAATCVVGTQLVLLEHAVTAGRVLFWIGLGLWATCMYAIFTALTVREDKPTLADGINGGWLAAIVATQSLCVLGGLLSPSFAASQRELLHFTLLALWLCGGMLYIWTISLIFYRYTFFRFLPSDLMPPYWINMGAIAISTLAGSTLIHIAPSSKLLASMLPFLKGFTLWYWATATWWIPMLAILAIWRHVVKRFPLTYDPLYWGAVFPLAMYTTSTHRLAGAVEMPALLALPHVFIWIALAAWSLTFTGLVIHVVRSVQAIPAPAAKLAEEAG